jgi:malate permease and related proteins
MNTSFGPFLVILLGLGLGVLLRRTGHLPTTAPKVLNAYVIAVAVPALVLARLPAFLRELSMHHERIDASLLFLPIIPWLIFGGAIVFFGLLYRMGWIRRDQWGLLALSGGLGNTAFVGFPLIEALLGPENLPPAILLDQLGTFLALSVGGTLWVSYFHSASTGFSWRKFTLELFRFPPFLALIAAFILALFEALPSFFQGGIESIASTLVPVAMVSVGAQLRFDRSKLRRELRGVGVGLGYKMVLAPIFIGVIAAGVVGMRGDPLSVAVLESAMAPMITSTVLGIEAGFAPELGALMLGIGIPFSLLSVPLISHLLSSLTH